MAVVQYRKKVPVNVDPFLDPIKRETWENCCLLKRYLEIIHSVLNHRQLVFADEKSMKELMNFTKTRRDILSGKIPKNYIPATAKNRYNILFSVNVKNDGNANLYYKILEESTDASIFMHFCNLYY